MKRRSFGARAIRRVAVTVNNGLSRLHQKLKLSAWNRYGKTTNTVTVSTRQGRLTVFTADQFIGKALFLYGGFEHDWAVAAVQWLRDQNRLPPKGTGTILDIGANIGVISIGMLTGGEFGRAVAVEPDPQNFELLERNARQNGFDDQRYVCLQFAVSDRPGEIEFERSSDNFGDHRVRVALDEHAGDLYGESKREVIRIPSEPLDALLSKLSPAVANDISVVWIDTQGHEGQVLRGGGNLFSNDIPVVAEVWPYGLERAGTTVEEFCGIASQYWSKFCIWREDHFEQLPMPMLIALLKEFNDSDQHENVIFLK